MSTEAPMPSVPATDSRTDGGNLGSVHDATHVRDARAVNTAIHDARLQKSGGSYCPDKVAS